MKRIIWRNRANAILGILVVIVAILEGPSTWMRTMILVALGVLITFFGLAKANNHPATEIVSLPEENSKSE